MKPSRPPLFRCLTFLILAIGLLPSALRAQDVALFFINKIQSHDQTSASGPGIANSFFFDAAVVPSATGGGLVSATLQHSSTATDTLTSMGPVLGIDTEFGDKSALDNAYPSSRTYTLNITGASDGLKSIPLSFGSDAYPNTPNAQNYNALQAVDPTQALTISWDAFTGGTTDDLIQIEIEDQQENTVFNSGGPDSMDALDGTATSVVVPANTLSANSSYVLLISFSNVLQFQPYDFATYGAEPAGAAVFSQVTALSVTTTSGAAMGGPDASLIAVTKSQHFQQDESGIPVLVDEWEQDSSRFKFEVFVDAAAQGSVTGSSVTVPGGAMHTLSADNENFQFGQGFSDKPELDQAFPAGTYTVTVNTANDGTKNLSLAVPADNYPNIPRVTNFGAAQSIDSTAAFTVNFDAFTGGTVNDFVMLEIEASGPMGNSQVYESPGPGENGSLDGTDTSATIPANTLSPGSTYIANLSFFRIVGNDPSYSTALVGFHKKTQFEIRTTGGTDTEAPWLVRTEPPIGTTNVKDISAIMFEFSEPMDASVDLSQAIQWTGVADANNFSYTWADDDTRLFCRYTPSLPLDTTINWTLNPSVGLDNAASASGAAKQIAFVTRLQDAAGNALQNTPQSGDFTTASGSNVGEKDVLRFLMTKSDTYWQDGASIISAEDFNFGFEAELNGFNTISSVEITPPGGSPITFYGEGHGDEIEIDAQYAEKSDLDAHAPNGTVGIQFNTFHDGTQTLSLDMPADAYPNIPMIQNHTALGTVDSSAAFTLNWNAFSNPGEDDAIVVIVSNEFDREIFETPFPGQMSVLPASATSLTIPANTLPPGRTLEAEIAFLKAAHIDDTSYAGVHCYAAFATLTIFEITTTGVPIIANLDMTSGDQGSFQFRLLGEKKMTYTIESSTDFSNWNVERVLNADDNISGTMGEFIFNHQPEQGTMLQFFRAKEGSHFGAGGSPTVQFNFLHFAYAGSFAGGSPTYTANPSFPIAINGFSPAVHVSNDSNFPAADQVSFTGPNGSGVSMTPGDSGNSHADQNGYFYQTAHISSPTTGTAGAWTFNYRGSDIPVDNVPDPDANNRLVIPSPTVTTSGGNISQIAWTFRAAGDGSSLSTSQAVAQAHMTSIQLQINHTGGSGYNSTSFDPNSIASDTGMAASNIPWNDVTQIHIVWNDDQNNHFVVSFDGPASAP